jgi:hypothetical protein
MPGGTVPGMIHKSELSWVAVVVPDTITAVGALARCFSCELCHACHDMGFPAWVTAHTRRKVRRRNAQRSQTKTPNPHTGCKASIYSLTRRRRGSKPD